jgi:LytS/YehU family sensor histidine kinase
VIILSIIIIAGIVADVVLHQWFAPSQIAPIPDRPYDFNNDAPFKQFSLIGTVFNNLITSILIIGSSTAFELFYKWLTEEKLRKDIEKEQFKTSLALLRHQVSPHFFMNTLNNIHSLIEIDTEKAQDAVERLSTLMRYLLYDSAQSTIELKKEVEFIYSFISLMQLRHSDEVKVSIVIPEQIPEVKIPPMLFISLLENAFKHGVSYPLKSFIYFELQFQETSLHCIVKNSKHNIPKINYGEYSGIGLENIKESLNLLYGNNFQLDIMDKENEFEVDLTIPL